MTVISIAVIWLVVGLVVAAMFGAAVWRTNRLREDEEVPQRAGAEVRYLRPAKNARCQLAKTALVNPLKKSSAKRDVIA